MAVGDGYLREWGVKVFVLGEVESQGWVVVDENWQRMLILVFLAVVFF